MQVVGGNDAAGQRGDAPAKPLDLEIGMAVETDHDLVEVVSVMLDGIVERRKTNGAGHVVTS